MIYSKLSLLNPFPINHEVKLYQNIAEDREAITPPRNKYDLLWLKREMAVKLPNIIPV